MIHTYDSIPMYIWDGTQVVKRTDEEIELERQNNLNQNISRSPSEYTSNYVNDNILLDPTMSLHIHGNGPFNIGDITAGWKFYQPNPNQAQININTNGIIFTRYGTASTTNCPYLIQSLTSKTNLSNKTVTFSIRYKTTAADGSFRLACSLSSGDKYALIPNSPEWNIFYITWTFNDLSSNFIFNIGIRANDDPAISLDGDSIIFPNDGYPIFKLELGDKSTLENEIPINYNEEYLKATGSAPIEGSNSNTSNNNESLLSNNYFIPGAVINIQGRTEYTQNNSNTIDRWYKSGAAGSINLTNEGLQFTGATINAQDLPLDLCASLRGKTVTASFEVVAIGDGCNAYLGLYSIGLNRREVYLINEAYTDIGIASKICTIPDDSVQLKYYIGSLSGNAIISCCDLEIGEVSTLESKIGKYTNYNIQYLKTTGLSPRETNGELLFNNWFSDGMILNTLGRETYESDMTNKTVIDGWRGVITSNSYVTVQNSGLVTGSARISGSTSWICQVLKPEIVQWIRGKYVTLSVNVVLFNPNDSDGYARLGLNGNGFVIEQFIKETGIISVSGLIPENASSATFILGTENGATALISQCSLEVGEVSTLKNKILPNKNIEYFKLTGLTPTQSNNGFLINSDFRFISRVNTQGKDYYDSSMTSKPNIDGWTSGLSSQASIALQSNGLVFSCANNGIAWGQQRLKPELIWFLAGKEVTLSLEIIGFISINTDSAVNLQMAIYTTSSGAVPGIELTQKSKGILSGTIKIPSDVSNILINIGTSMGGTAIISQAKLELGNISTLKNSTPPNYNTQYLETTGLAPMKYNRQQFLYNNNFLPGNIINSSGLSMYGLEYNGLSTIDGWKCLMSAPALVWIRDIGLSLSAEVNNGMLWIAQRSRPEVAKYLQGKEITFSIEITQFTDSSATSSGVIYLSMQFSSPTSDLIVVEIRELVHDGIASISGIVPVDCTSINFVIGVENGAQIAISRCDAEYINISKNIDRQLPDYNIEFLKVNSATTTQSNENFVPNSWLSVWQSGTNFAGHHNVITADCWRINNYYGIINFVKDPNGGGIVSRSGVTVSPASVIHAGDLQIAIENPQRFNGKTMTFSTMTTLIGSYAANTEFGLIVNGIEHILIQGTNTVTKNMISSYTIKLPSSITSLILIPMRMHSHTQTGLEVNIRAVKFELGSISTLKNDIEPDYATELLKCQRYRFVIQSNTWLTRVTAIGSYNLRFFVPLPVPLRIRPTYINNPLSITNIGAAVVSGFTFDPPILTGNGLDIQAVKTGHGLTDAILRLNSGGIFDASL